MVAGAARVTVDYPALMRHCFTVNAYNRVHIDLESRLSPLELATLRRSVERSGAAPPTRAWLARLEALNAEMFERPQPFMSRHLAPGVTLFEDAMIPRAKKRLLVAFCGNANRLLLPIPVFLQFVAAARWDVLLLQKGIGGSYVQGIGDIGGGIPGIAEAVRELAQPGLYRSMTMLGVSGGGAAAIEVAILLRATRGVSVCGSPPPEETGISAGGPGGPDLLYAYGAAHARDQIGATALMERYGGRTLPLPGVDKHNAFAVLLERREFGAYLGTMLGEAAEASPDQAEIHV